MNTFIERHERTIIRIITAVGVLLALFLLAATLGKLKENRFIGSGMEAANTITVTGQGKVERAPDTAKVSFSVRSESKDLKSAQTTVSGKVDAITKALKDLSIEERHIKTDSYTSYPQYNYDSSPCYGINCPRTPTIRGYEVAHAITVSIKDLEKVNDVLGILATNQVSDMNGPNFGFEDDKAIAREARALAISDAEAEAKVLARQLGVKIIRIVSFNEQGNYPMPYYAMDAVGNGALKEQAASAPTLPTGDQKIQSNVTIVYEIR
jgi:uncharacterized protein